MDLKTNNGIGFYMVGNGGNLYFGGLNRSGVLSLALHFSMGFPHGRAKNPSADIEKMFRNCCWCLCLFRPPLLGSFVANAWHLRVEVSTITNGNLNVVQPPKVGSSRYDHVPFLVVVSCA